MYRKIVLVVFGLLVAFSAIYALIDRKKVTTSSDQAYKAYLKGEEYRSKLYYKEALQEFEQAVEFDPNFAMALMRMAWLYHDFDRKDEYKQAKERALSRLDKVKEMERIQIQLSFARVEKNTDDIDKYSNELLKKFPDSFEAQNYLAGKYWTAHEIDSAIIQNLKLIEMDPGFALAYNMLGYLYYAKAEYDKSLEFINRYSMIAEGQANPHDSYGEILLRLGRYDDALREFQIADSIKPDLDFVIAHIGDTYAAMGMFRNAIGAYLKAGELAINEIRRLENNIKIARCYIYSDRSGDAIILLKEVVEDMPNFMSPHAVLGGIYASEGMIEDALIELGMVKGIIANEMAKWPRDDTTAAKKPPIDQIYLEAKIAASRERYDESISKYKDILKEISLPSSLYFSHLLADCYVKSQMADSAIVVLNEALSHNPNYALCLKTLAEAHKLAGQESKQKEALLRLLSVLKDADDNISGLKQAYAELERLNSESL